MYEFKKFWNFDVCFGFKHKFVIKDVIKTQNNQESLKILSSNGLKPWPLDFKNTKQRNIPSSSDWYHLLGHHFVNTSNQIQEIRWEIRLGWLITIWKIKVQEFPYDMKLTNKRRVTYDVLFIGWS